MEVFLGLAVLAALVYFAFGELIARIFVGAALGALATLLCVVMGISIVDMQRQDAARPSYVRMGSAR